MACCRTAVAFSCQKLSSHRLIKNYELKGMWKEAAQAVSRWSITAEARVCDWGSPSGICGGHIGTGTGFFPEFFSFARRYHSTCLYMLIYHMRDEQGPLVAEVRGIVSPRRHKQQTTAV
jgi:hypothetical protein